MLKLGNPGFENWGSVTLGGPGGADALKEGRLTLGNPSVGGWSVRPDSVGTLKVARLKLGISRVGSSGSDTLGSLGSDTLDGVGTLKDGKLRLGNPGVESWGSVILGGPGGVGALKEGRLRLGSPSVGG
jgi:hypothetical protein